MVRAYSTRFEVTSVALGGGPGDFPVSSHGRVRVQKAPNGSPDHRHSLATGPRTPSCSDITPTATSSYLLSPAVEDGTPRFSTTLESASKEFVVTAGARQYESAVGIDGVQE